MQTTSQVTSLDDPDYPSSDGKPMADNTKQFDWIVEIKEGLDGCFNDNPDVLVVGNLLWYPVEGQNKIRAAPDTMVIFGRPKGHRGSYIQHREGGIAPQVDFAGLSPGNRAGEMRRKLAFYERYGVDEYYILDPDFKRHKGYLRDESGKLVPIPDLFGWTSPRLNVRFEMTDELRIFGPDGRRFEPYLTVVRQRDESDLRAEEERDRAGQERARAEQEKQRADEATLWAERLLAQLRALRIEPEA